MLASRMIHLVAVAAVVALASSVARADAPPTVVVRAARMLDVKAGRLVRDAAVVVSDGNIVAAGAGVATPAGATVIDLGDATLLPGLIDCHTHLMARMGEGADGYTLSLATKSQAFRALEGAANARATLHAGFTTVRDVESEGSGYADVALRDAIDQGLVEGPRMLVATRGIAAVGSYFPFGVAPELADRFPTGAQMVSGVEEARRAAREQLGHGADLIKIYADWWDGPTLTVDELRVVVDEAHKHGKKVAAHADTVPGIKNALTAGVDSIEHASEADAATLALMKQKNVVWVTTRAAFAQELARAKQPQARAWLQGVVERGRANLATARKIGLRFAPGYDASSAEDQGHNARELVELHRLGVPAAEVIHAATVTAAALLGRDRLGALDKGHAADIIAVAGDPLADIRELEHVRFVMKGGVVIENSLLKK